MLVDLNVKGHFRHDEDGTSLTRRHLNGAAKVNTKFHSLKFFDLFRLLLCPIEIVSLLALSTMSHNRNQLSPKTRKLRSRKLTSHFICGACFNDVNLSTRPVAARPLAIENTTETTLEHYAVNDVTNSFRSPFPIGVRLSRLDSLFLSTVIENRLPVLPTCISTL